MVSRSSTRLATAAFIVFLGIILSKILAYAFRIIVARHYGPEVYGSITLLLAIMGLFVTFASLGLTDGLARYLPRYLSQRKDKHALYTIRFVAALTFVAGFIAFILFYAGADVMQSLFFKSQEMTPLLHFFSFLLFAWLFTNIALVIISSYERIVLHSLLSDVLPNVIRLVTVACAAYLGLQSSWVYGAYVLSLIGIFIFSFLISLTLIKKLKRTPLKETEKRELRASIFAYSWPIIITGAVIKLSTWIDSLMLGYFLNEAAVGFYNAALPIAALLIIIAESFFPLFFPLINKEHAKGDTGSVQKMTRRITKWALLCNLPLLALMVVFPKTLIQLLFGTDYLVASSALQILAVGFFFTGLFSISSKLLLMSGQSRFLMKNSIAFLIVSFALNALFISQWGIQGAAWATSLTLVGSYFSLALKAHKETPVLPLDKTSLKIIVSAIIPAIVFLFVYPAFYISQLFLFAIYILVYLSLLIMFKTLDKEDFALMHALKRKFVKKS